MNIVTGFRNEPHVTAEDMRVLIRSVYGNGSAITAIGEKLDPELISNNEVRIHDGAIVQQGCFGRIEANTYEVITIDNGSQDMKRIDLIVSRYEMNADTGIESMTLKLIKGEESEGTPIEPSYVSGNIEDGDLVDEFPLFRINLDGITVTSVDRLAEPVQQVYSFDSIAESEMSPALRNHSIGDYFVYNGKLYKATSAITVGTNLEVGGNIEQTTLGGERGSNIYARMSWGNINVSNNAWATNTGGNGNGINADGSTAVNAYNLALNRKGKYYVFYKVTFNDNLSKTGLRGIRFYIGEINSGEEFVAPSGNNTTINAFRYIDTTNLSNSNIRMGLFQSSGGRIAVTNIQIYAIYLGK